MWHFSCERKGRYNVRKLIEKYGRKANMTKMEAQLNGDCLWRDAPQLRDRCELVTSVIPGLLHHSKNHKLFR